MSLSRRDFLKRFVALTAAGVLVPLAQTVEAVQRFYPLDRTMGAGAGASVFVRPGDLIVVRSYRGEPFPGTSFSTPGLYRPIVDLFIVGPSGTLACTLGMDGALDRVHHVEIKGRYERVVNRRGSPPRRAEDYFALRTASEGSAHDGMVGSDHCPLWPRADHHLEHRRHG